MRSLRWTAALGSLSRFHIVMIAAGGSLVFGWLLTGRFWPLIAAVVAVDWFLVNLVNRVVDVDEDRENGITATEIAASHRRGLVAASLVVYAGSFAIHLVWLPALLPVRLAYHLLGLLYNVRLIPAPGGRRGQRRRVRLKELLTTKNAASNLGFLITLFAYPLVALPLSPDTTAAGLGPLRVALLILFFAPFEYSFEVIYDLRDVRGDRAAGVRTWPVVYGPRLASALVIGLNVFAVHVALWGAVFGVLAWKDAVLAIGPLVQLALFLPASRRGVTARDCIRVTWAFSLMLLGYCAWVLLGLPTSLPARLSPETVVQLGLVVVAGSLWWWLRPGLGDRRFWAVYVAIAVSAWAGEHSAVAIYSFYHYAPDWRLFVGEVPLAVAVIWPMVVLSAWDLLGRLGLRGLSLVGWGGALVFVEAAFIEVVGVHSGMWRWEGTGPLGVPIIGLVGWAAFGAAALFAVERLRGLWLLVLPVLGLTAVHGAVLALWYGGLSTISYTPVADNAALIGLAVVMVSLSALALTVRRRRDIAFLDVIPRALAAELLYASLIVASAPWSAVAASLLFALPYLALFRLKHHRQEAPSINP